jgi:tRNA-splicing ligase RtcB (3'-phosphate/5'-hydroxy nucleic acid ligase)
MGRNALVRREALVWELPRTGSMRTKAVLFGTPSAISAMEDGVFAQLRNVASLPGIVSPALAMPDAHTGYGFPIGAVAAFDPDAGGVVSAGGVGFDIACGVRTLVSNLCRQDIEPVADILADRLFTQVPAGLGTGGQLRLSGKDMNRMLMGGAVWAVGEGYGEAGDLARCEEGGKMAGADPELVSDRARERQRDELGTLGSGNHYLEVQYVEEIYDARAATAYGLRPEQIVVSIHCGSRGLGHQVATDHMAAMRKAAPRHGLVLPDRELACAPIASGTGTRYLGAMRAAVNCALAGRQVITYLVRQVFAALFPGCSLPLLFDVSHNTCKVERHAVGGVEKNLYVHRKGATRALGPSHPDLPDFCRGIGQPVIIGGSMGTSSYILSGADTSLTRSFSSACHGAGRAMSRKQAATRFSGHEILAALTRQGIAIRAQSMRGIGEEAPGAYKDIEEVAQTTHTLGLATKTARICPLACIKG